MRNAKGFTLVEVIVAIAIIGILTAIAVISAPDWVTRYRVAGQTKQLYADLMNARVSALQRNRVFFVTLGSGQYAVYEDTVPSPDGNGILDPGDRLVMQTTTKYTLATSPSMTGFTFTANGLASFATGTAVDIWCQSTANPASDCVDITLTRILTGKWNGSNCIVQ